MWIITTLYGSLLSEEVFLEWGGKKREDRKVGKGCCKDNCKKGGYCIEEKENGISQRLVEASRSLGGKRGKQTVRAAWA